MRLLAFAVYYLRTKTKQPAEGGREKQMMRNFQSNIYPDYSRKKIIVISIAIASLILNSVVSAILGEQNSVAQTIDYIVIIALNFLVFAWCHYDSAERDDSFTTGWRFLVIILGIIALFIYFFKTRDTKQAFIAIGWFWLIALGASVISGLAAAIVHMVIGVR